MAAQKTQKKPPQQDKLEKKLRHLPTIVSKMDSDIQGEAVTFFLNAKKTLGEINELQKELTGEDPGLSFQRLYELADAHAGSDPEEMQQLKQENEVLREANAGFALTEKRYQEKINSLDILVNRKKQRELRRQEKHEAREQRRLERQAKKANSAGTSDDDTDREMRIAGRTTLVTWGAYMVAETMHLSKFEIGYALDSAAAIAAIPAYLVLGFAGGAVTGSVLGKTYDFIKTGFRAFNFGNFGDCMDKALEDKPPSERKNHYSMIAMGCVLGALGSVGGALVGLANGVQGWGPNTYKWRHNLLHDDTQQKVIKTNKVTAFNQTLEDVVASKPNTVAFPVKMLPALNYL